MSKRRWRVVASSVTVMRWYWVSARNSTRSPCALTSGAGATRTSTHAPVAAPTAHTTSVEIRAAFAKGEPSETGARSPGPAAASGWRSGSQRAHSAVAKSMKPIETTSGSRESRGMSQNEVAIVPTMLPAVDVAYRPPADRPMRSIPREAARLIPSGETIASSSAGRKKMSAEATSEPARGPRSALHGRTGTATIGAITVSRPAAAIGGRQRARPSPAVRHVPAGPVAQAESDHDRGDDAAPHEDRVAERRRQDAGGDELEPHEGGTAHEHDDVEHSDLLLEVEFAAGVTLSCWSRCAV